MKKEILTSLLVKKCAIFRKYPYASQAIFKSLYQEAGWATGEERKNTLKVSEEDSSDSKIEELDLEDWYAGCEAIIAKPGFLEKLEASIRAAKRKTQEENVFEVEENSNPPQNPTVNF